MYYGYQRISLNDGYQRISSLISKDIFLHSRFSRVYPAISFISSNSFIDIQLFIHSYPVFYPRISIISCFYPDISTSYPTFLSFSILLFILRFTSIPLYPDRYPAGYSIWFSAAAARLGVLLDRTLFCMSCSATE
jgi:hypothetical protein